MQGTLCSNKAENGKVLKYMSSYSCGSTRSVNSWRHFSYCRCSFAVSW